MKQNRYLMNKLHNKSLQKVRMTIKVIQIFLKKKMAQVIMKAKIQSNQSQLLK